VSGWVWIWIAIPALVAGAVLSALVQSLRDLSRTTLEEIAAIRNRPAATKRIERILEDVEGHTAAVALPRVICNLVLVVALVAWVGYLRQGQQDGVAPVLTWVDAVIGVGAASLLLWMFAVILPTSVAKHAGDGTVYAWSGVIRACFVLGKPFGGAAKIVDEVVRRLSGQGDKDVAVAIQDELLSVVQEAKEEGKFDQSEKEMIEAVVEFRNRTVAQVMTPRTEIEAIELTNDLGRVTTTVRDIGHSRIPVYEESLDHIVGVFYVKDLMKWLAGEARSGHGKGFDLKSLLRPAFFVPETKTIRELLPELLNKRVHIAMVADEYGGTAGLVTIEDIVEEVFGDIQDEYEEPEQQAAEVKVEAATRTAEIDARAYIADVNAEIKPLGVELPESEDYDTVGGFVTVTMGRIPAAGESFAHGRIVVTVLGAEATRVTKVKVQVSEAEGEEEAGAEREEESKHAKA
jgi:magnesium and cobalt exporter, CNNM family